MNEQTLFAEALDRTDPQSRAAFLDQACRGDAALRERIERLLAQHEHAGAFLESPQSPLGPTVDAPATENTGTMIGPFKLLEQIGEGGFGVVYLAEQTQPVRRKVALKILKPGMNTKQVVARFEAERQALAIMDHPNIAKVFDGGATPSGRPYFVMELVKGVPITEFCDQNHLTPRQRLELFVPVCQAVQHAHQKGIIHRDLKPSNVLVTRHDTTPIVKVIDFGVAKALGQNLTDKTLFTGIAHMIGTPLYMSPEQAGMSDLDVDTRSDIYSLGVLLYELLTGTTPFNKERFKKAAYDEIRRIIREEEPPKPSTRLSDLSISLTPREESRSSLASVAAQRQTEPAKLTKLVRGELDWIVMKALEKDRSRRYETANSFAMDVQRYLADEAVQACPPSAGYRLRKFARRNRSGLSVAGLVLFFLVLLGSLAGWAWRDRAARTREAELERVARAAEQANHLERAVERAELLQREGKRNEALAALERCLLLAREAEAAAPLSERIESLQQLLDAEGRDEAFVARFETIRREVQTEVNAEKSEFRGRKSTFPKIREALEHYGIAVEATPPAVAVTHIQKRPAAIQTIILTALDECLDPLRNEKSGARGWLIDVLQRADGDPWRNKVRRAWEQPAALAAITRDVDVRQHPPSFLLLVAKAMPIESPGRLDLQRRLQFAYPGDFWANHDLGWVLTKGAGQHAEAVRYYTAALSLRPDNPGVMLNRAKALESAKELDAAVADLQRAITVSPRYTMAHNNLGNVMWKLRNYDKAIECYRNAVELSPEDPDRYDVLFSHMNSVDAKVCGAIHNLSESLEIDPRFAPIAMHLRGDYWFLLLKQRESQTVAWLRNLMERNPFVPETYARLGSFLIRRGKADEAITVWRQGLERLPGEAKLAVAMAHQGWQAAIHSHPMYRKQGIEAAQEAVKHAPQSELAWQYLGWVQYRIGDWQASIESLERSCKLENGGKGDSGQWIVLALAHAKLAAQEGRPEKDREHHKVEARRWYEQASKELDGWGKRARNEVGQAIWAFRAEAQELMFPKESKK